MSKMTLEQEEVRNQEYNEYVVGTDYFTDCSRGIRT